MTGLPGMHGPTDRAIRWGGALVVAVVVGGLAWAAGDGLAAVERGRLVRYIGVLVSAALAIGAPHVMFPDPHVRALQLSNASPGALLRRQMMRWLPVPLLAAVPALVISLQGGAGWIAMEGVLSVLAVGAFAFVRASGLGLRVQAWERLEAGGWYRGIKQRAEAVSSAPLLAVPDALVPGLLLTANVFLVGSIVGIAGQAAGLEGGLAAAVALAVVAGVLTLRQRPAFDRAFWTTNGVWADAFRQSDPEDARSPLAYESVYWAPRGVRASVWAGLVSLDRQVPLGRLAAVGLALLAGVHLTGLSEGVRLAALALYIAVVNGGVALTAADTAFPGARLYRTGGSAQWMLARFLMNVRWLPPLVAVGLLLMWLTGLEGEALIVWTVVDLGVAALTAVLVTLIARFRFRRALA